MIKQYKNLIFLVSSFLLLILLIFNTYSIPAGYTGVLIRHGLIDERPVKSGIVHFTIPLAEKIIKVNNHQQDFSISNAVWGETSDKAHVYAKDIIVTFQILPERSAWMYANASISSPLTEPLVASAIRSAMVELKADEVANRSKIEPLVLTKLNASLEGKYGADTVYVCKVLISEVDFDDDYREVSLAAQERAKAEIQARTEMERAEAHKAIAILEAQAKAEQVRIAAEAEAEANRKIHESLTPELISMMKIKAWDGKLPNVVSDLTKIDF